jgi:phosphoribosylanthranilate isomerase
MTWIKICGITNLEDALTAVDAGADALGFVFYERSPRKVDPETAREIVGKLPDTIEKIGVFVEQTAEEVHEIVDQVGLTAVQLYQQERAEAFDDYRKLAPSTARREAKIIFVIPGDQFADSGGVHLRNGMSWLISKSFKNILFAVLIDSSSATQPGGTGQRFDWIGVRGFIPPLGSLIPTIVAGGLEPSNVSVAMTLLHPWGVDVASGVEARPGKKDPEKVKAFISAVRLAEKSV